MTVKLDVSGMFFGIEVDFVAGETIRDLLLRVQALTNAPGYDLNKPKIEFLEEPFDHGEFQLDGITVTHRNRSGLSRQVKTDKLTGMIIVNEAGEAVRRTYQGGIYHFSDDSAKVDADRPTQGLRAVDPNKPFVSAWQYYVYDIDGVDLARKRPVGGDPILREIVPYSRRKPVDIIEDGQTIVWRLITIFVRPTHADRSDYNIATRDKTPLV
jgi:hypothetical protein